LGPVTTNRSVGFFNAQFRKQVDAGEFALNPFEQAALPFVAGRVLDLGCGLGNLSLEAARRGCEVTAVDASAAAIQRLAQAAAAENLRLKAGQSDLAGYSVAGAYDTVVAIGLVMFFDCAEAERLLGEIRRGVAPGGRAIVNTLVEGTTWMDPFEPGRYCLMPAGALERTFAGWEILLARRDEFPAPGGKLKKFETVIARRR
jgi:tellurite methyltransferase